MFFITAIVSDEKFRRNCRTFGYGPDLLTVLDYVKQNTGDMYECLYDYLVIEKIGPGIHAEAEQFAWYKWEHPKWVKCERPIEFAHLVNWAIG
jgi:hypothetical protein